MMFKNNHTPITGILGLNLPPSVALQFFDEAKADTGSTVVATESERSTDPYLPANPVDRDRRRSCRPAL
jgi:hypothetical protein